MKFDINNKARILFIGIMTGTLFISTYAIADDYHSDKKTRLNYLEECEYRPLANNFQNQINQKVCVDAPVDLKKVKVIFDMTKGATGLEKHTGLRHMVMLGGTLKKRVEAGLMDADDINVVGIIHGSTAVKQLATVNGQPRITDETEKLINQIFDLKNAGININLEVCGATVNGMIDNMMATNEEMTLAQAQAMLTLYGTDNNMIHTNQGAIGRMIDLQHKGYTLIKE